MSFLLSVGQQDDLESNPIGSHMQAMRCGGTECAACSCADNAKQRNSCVYTGDRQDYFFFILEYILHVEA